jgi:hypothetical protein
MCIQASNISLQLLLVEFFNLIHFLEQIMSLSFKWMSESQRFVFSVEKQMGGLYEREVLLLQCL